MLKESEIKTYFGETLDERKKTVYEDNYLFESLEDVQKLNISENIYHNVPAKVETFNPKTNITTTEIVDYQLPISNNSVRFSNYKVLPRNGHTPITSSQINRVSNNVLSGWMNYSSFFNSSSKRFI